MTRLHGHPGATERVALGARRGFTLLELLIVITVLALLASIVLPAALHVRRRAARQVCNSNLHQLELALQMYHDEFDGYPETSYLPSTDPPPVIYAADVFGKYLSADAHVFHCPGDVPGASDRPPPNRGRSYFDTERSSYAPCRQRIRNEVYCYWAEYRPYYFHPR